MTKQRKPAAGDKWRQGGDRPAAGAKRVAFYQRVSTGGQTTAKQRRELQAVAKRLVAAWSVDRLGRSLKNLAHAAFYLPLPHNRKPRSGFFRRRHVGGLPHL